MPQHSANAPEVPGIRPPGFRLPPSSHVGAVKLQVADLERSLSFYRDLIGFRVIDRPGPWGGRRALLGAEDASTVLIELHEKRGIKMVPRRGLLGLYHFAVLLPERPPLGAFLRRLAVAGVHAGTADHGYSESIYLNDPDGLGMEIYADQPRETWVIRDREIVGKVDSLDVNALVRLADGRTWSGLPAGTTIGHVHLFVGDLTQAAEFYHAGLGFDKVGWSFAGALFVSAGGYHHHVGLNVWAAGAPVASDSDAKLLEWELLLPDSSSVEAATASLRHAGYPVERTDAGFLSRDLWGITARLRT